MPARSEPGTAPPPPARLGDAVMTCAGGLEGVDPMLRLVANAQGERLAAEVIDQTLARQARAATAPQRSALGQGIEGQQSPARAAITLILSSVGEPLPAVTLARWLGQRMSGVQVAGPVLARTA